MSWSQLGLLLEFPRVTPGGHFLNLSALAGPDKFRDTRLAGYPALRAMQPRVVPRPTLGAVDRRARRPMTLLASQLGHPRGLMGLLVGRLLNRANKGLVAAAVTALSPAPGQTTVDVGFGGGLGLDLLLRAVGPGGQVLGVEVSETMLGRAARRFRTDIAADRLRLQSGSMTDLPLMTGSVDGALTVNTLYFVDDLDLACAELRRVIGPSARLVIGLGDPGAMARMPFTQTGFRLRPVAEVIDRLRGAGLGLEDHRRVGSGDNAPHLLVATPTE